MGRDYGTQYRHGIYPHSPEQMEAARACVARVQAALPPGKRCHTEVVEAQVFWPAEEMHRAPHAHHTPNTPPTHPHAETRDREPRRVLMPRALCDDAEQYLQKGGRLGSPQSASKGCTDSVRCYG